jgi:hypothetical protein
MLLYRDAIATFPEGKGDTMLVNLLGDSAQVKVIEFFLEHTQYDHTKTEVATEAKISKASAQNAITALAGVGVLSETRKFGNNVFYRMDPENPIAKTLGYLKSQIKTAHSDKPKTAAPPAPAEKADAKPKAAPPTPPAPKK